MLSLRRAPVTMFRRISSSRTWPMWAGILFVLLLLAGPGLVPTGGHAPLGVPAPSAVPHPALLHRAIPIHPPSRPLALTRTAAVNPYGFYSIEPAPMGITDFGVNGTGGGYTYQTSEFYGVTTIHKLSVYNPAISSAQLTIQLNVVLTFYVGGVSYQYWVQDVAFIDTSSPSSPNVQFENNIWNFSSSGAGLDSNSVVGNGSIFSNSVYIASGSGTGNGINLALPAQIGLLAAATVPTSGTYSGDPEVIFQYRDGYGLETYDNAFFPFAHGATSVNYTVDGTNYNNFGLYNDAELVLGGPGNGYATSATSAQLSMSLSYFNGRNFQSVPNAFSFGSDTAEAISNLTTSLGSFAQNGSLMDNLSFKTTNSLKSVYNNSYVGTVNIVTEAANAVVKLNGTTGTHFSVGPINLTLAPGTYAFALYAGTTLLGEQNATLARAGYLDLYIDSGTVSTINFEETGLPLNHSWTISFGASQQTSTTSTIRFLTINGTVGWHLEGIPGFVPNITQGQLSIAGQGATVDINFTEIFYAVNIFESGLPSRTNWSYTIANHTYSSTGIGIAFQLPNGTFRYTIGLVPGYWTGGPASGPLGVAGAAVQRTLNFRAFTYAIVAAESGLPSGAFWGIEVGGHWTNGSVPTLVASGANGSFAVRVAAEAGYIVNSTPSSVQVTAAPAFLNVSFAAYRLPVEFVVQGLPAGTLWGVLVGSTHLNSTTTTIHLTIPNGTYSYAVDPNLAYVNLTPLAGNFQVLGQPTNVSVIFGPHPALLGRLTGSVVPENASLSINGTAYATVNGAFDLSLTPGGYEVEVSLSGYHPFFLNVTVYPGGTTLLGTITLQKVTVTPIPTHVATTPPPSSGISLLDLEIIGLALAVAIGLIALAYQQRPRDPRNDA
jgi:hypothetical protein